jgi:chitosanase
METKHTIIEILNSFETGNPETDYVSIFIYRDGPNKTKQVTLGRGYTEDGTLWDVFESYKSLGGKEADKLLSFKKFKGDESLPKNKEFLDLIINTAKNDNNFKEAQDLIYDKMYWNKGLAWFNKNKLIRPLSLAVVQDSYLHSGSIIKSLTNKFSECTPLNGGNEVKWVSKYLEIRYNWLKNHPNKILNNTVYRPQFFLEQIKNNNWDLNKFPITANGCKIVN